MIYILNMRGTPYYKVGYTDGDPERRKAQLQTGCPLPLDIVAQVIGDRALEASLHRRWQSQRADAANEWFTLTKEQLQEMLGEDLNVNPRTNVIMEGELWPLTTTFKQWLLKQSGRDDTVGDFARDAIYDKDAPDDRAGWKTWRSYLQLRHVCGEVVEAFGEAWMEFSHARKGVA